VTRRAWVIGTPIRHSLSPAMHNAAFAACGLDARYEAAEVMADDLEDWVAATRRDDVLGFNVTVPHKEAVAMLVDEVQGDALLAQAVNTVLVRHGARGLELAGVNTDTVGFRRALLEEADTTLAGKSVLLLGAGGAARAIAVVALQDGAAELAVANRHLSRADSLLRDLSPLRRGTKTYALALDDSAMEDRARRAEVLINATSVGMGSAEMPIDAGLVGPESLVVDIVYNPLQTALLRTASERGAHTIGGLGMLVQQAAAAFELWTSAPAPTTVMRRAALEELASR
jgi:shikimate dehydrogenase